MFTHAACCRFSSTSCSCTCSAPACPSPMRPRNLRQPQRLCRARASSLQVFVPLEHRRQYGRDSLPASQRLSVVLRVVPGPLRDRSDVYPVERESDRVEAAGYDEFEAAAAAAAVVAFAVTGPPGPCRPLAYWAAGSALARPSAPRRLRRRDRRRPGVGSSTGPGVSSTGAGVGRGVVGAGVGRGGPARLRRRRSRRGLPSGAGPGEGRNRVRCSGVRSCSRWNPTRELADRRTAVAAWCELRPPSQALGSTGIQVADLARDVVAMRGSSSRPAPPWPPHGTGGRSRLRPRCRSFESRRRRGRAGRCAESSVMAGGGGGVSRRRWRMIGAVLRPAYLRQCPPAGFSVLACAIKHDGGSGSGGRRARASPEQKRIHRLDRPRRAEGSCPIKRNCAGIESNSVQRVGSGAHGTIELGP